MSNKDILNTEQEEQNPDWNEKNPTISVISDETYKESIENITWDPEKRVVTYHELSNFIRKNWNIFGIRNLSNLFSYDRFDRFKILPNWDCFVIKSYTDGNEFIRINNKQKNIIKFLNWNEVVKNHFIIDIVWEIWNIKLVSYMDNTIFEWIVAWNQDINLKEIISLDEILENYIFVSPNWDSVVFWKNNVDNFFGIFINWEKFKWFSDAVRIIEAKYDTEQYLYVKYVTSKWKIINEKIDLLWENNEDDNSNLISTSTIKEFKQKLLELTELNNSLQWQVELKDKWLTELKSEYNELKKQLTDLETKNNKLKWQLIVNTEILNYEREEGIKKQKILDEIKKLVEHIWDKKDIWFFWGKREYDDLYINIKLLNELLKRSWI